MKFFRLLLILILVQPLTSLASGLSLEQSKKFLFDSGLSELIASLPDSMEQQLNIKRLSESSSVSFDKTSQAISQAARQVDGEKIALVYLSQEERGKALSAALDFLASPLGQRISVEERAASSPEAQLEMQAYAMNMASNPATPARNKLVQKLADALNADQVVLQLMKGVHFSILDVSTLLNPTKAKALKVIMEHEWQGMEPALSQQFSQFMALGAHYSYRNLNDKDLSAYIDFLNSEAGQAYWHAGIDIIDLYIQGFVSELVAQMSVVK